MALISDLVLLRGCVLRGFSTRTSLPPILPPIRSPCATFALLPRTSDLAVPAALGLPHAGPDLRS
jgi:hypothetical protein